MSPVDLRAARKFLGLTQHGLAEELGMGRWGFQTVGKWENGKVPISKRAAAHIEALVARKRAERNK